MWVVASEASWTEGGMGRSMGAFPYVTRPRSLRGISGVPVGGPSGGLIVVLEGEDGRQGLSVCGVWALVGDVHEGWLECM